MRHTLTAVFDDRGKAQQALAELLACGYPAADAILTTVPGTGAARPDRPPLPAWRERPGASSARLLARLVGHPDVRRKEILSRPHAPESHILALSTGSAQEAERAAGLISRFMIGTAETAPPTGRQAGLIGPDAGQGAAGAGQTAYRFGHDMHENERYRNRSWREADADLKVLWQARGPQQPGWDRSEAEVRLGWDSTSPEIDDDSHYRNHWRTHHAVRAHGAGAGRAHGSAAPPSESGNAPARGHTGKPTSWENFMDAVRNGWSRTRIGNDMDEADYRLHHAGAYPGTNYDDLAPVYRYGRHLRNRAMFAGQSWNEAEDALRAEWERGHREGKPATWEEMKAALHAGWDRDRT